MPHVAYVQLLTRGGYDLLEKKLLDEKTKRIQEEALLSDNPKSLNDPPSPIKRHVKWKVARFLIPCNVTHIIAIKFFEIKIMKKLYKFSFQVTIDRLN